MRVLLIVTLCNAFYVVSAQFDIINEDIGDFHLRAHVGRLPLKYVPLSVKDQKASNKASELIDFLPLIPYIDPLVLPELPALGIDVPFLWLRGQIFLRNFLLAGVKELQLREVELRLINLRSDLNITIPHIYFEGDLHLQATLSFIPVIYSCHMSANLFDVEVMVSSGGYMVKVPPVGEVLQIDSADVQVDIQRFVLNLTNIVTGEEREENILSPAPQLFSRNVESEGDIFNGLLSTALDYANKELLEIPIGFFEEYLLSDTF